MDDVREQLSVLITGRAADPPPRVSGNAHQRRVKRRALARISAAIQRRNQIHQETRERMQASQREMLSAALSERFGVTVEWV